MLLELLLAAVVLIALLSAIYTVAVATIQVLTVTDDAEMKGSGLSERRQRLLSSMARNPQEVLLTADLFKSLVFLVLIVGAFWAVPRWMGDWGWLWIPFLGVVLAVLWLLRVLVGEVLPKTVPVENLNQATLGGVIRLALVWWLFRPVFSVARWVSRRHTRAARSAEEREEIVERALESLAQTAGIDEPVIEADEREMIQGVIGLDTTEVRELMVPRIHIVALPADATLEDVRKATAEHGHSRMPVYEGDLDSIIGILYIKDLFTAADDDQRFDLARLARDAFVVPETKKVDALLEEFKKRQTHVAIVADEFGGTAGLITLEDILEEIVGEIQDEHDRREGPIEQVAEDTVRVEGVVSLEDIADALGVNLPDDKFETVGGLIYDHVGGIPEAGQIVEAYGLRFHIDLMDGQRISQVRVTRTGRSSRSPA